VVPELEITEVAPIAAKAPATPWLRPELVASWWEIAAVIILVQGHFIYTSTIIFLRRSSGIALSLQLNDYREIHRMGVESAILALFLVYLHWRGWTPQDLKIKVTRPGLAQGIFLGIAVLFVENVGNFIIRNAHGVPWLLFVANHPAHRVLTHLSWAAMIPSEAMNALFEEVTCMCYVFNQAAAKRGPLFALVFMLILRAAYHTWKDPAYLILTLIHFSILGLWYWRTKNVWPLIIAHLAYDLVVIAPQIR